jgi:tetratricopeptide (TPR) repeat protein
MKKQLTLLPLFLLLLLPGCMVKSTLKKGAAYETAGMFKDASELYYQAVLKKPSSPELKIALKRAGQLYLDDQADLISQSFNRNDYRSTVYSCQAAREFNQKVSHVGIDLKPDPSIDRYFSEAKENYLASRYEDGQRNITDQRFSEAKEIFAEIVRIDPEYRDAGSYLKQATFEPVYREGARLFGEGRYMQAWAKWKTIADQDRNYRDVAEQMIQALNERYKQGSVSLMNENFPDAAQALGEVYKADPAFKDVRQLFTEARNEPVYRQGNAFLTSGKCRTAWYSFDQVIRDAGAYKDASALKDRALACAQYPIAVTTTERRGYSQGSRQFQIMVVGQLINQKNIFLKFYDLADLEQRVVLQLFSAGKPDLQMIQQIASRQNFKAILYIEFTELSREDGNRRKTEKTGFERTSVKNQAGETVYNDKQVKYNEFWQRNSVTATLLYRLVSSETGEILLSDRVSESRSDEIRYAEYSGVNDNLYPADAIPGGFTINTVNYRSLQNLLKASKNITTTEKLMERAYTPMTQKIASVINNFNPEK